MKKSAATAAILAALPALVLSGVQPATAAPMEIKFSSPSPPRAHLNVQIFGPWTKKVTAESGGTLDVKLVAGPVLASHRNIYDRVITNVAQIGWGIQAFFPGKFPRTGVVTLPMNFETSTEASHGLWNLYKKGLLGNEYDAVKPLALFTFPAASFHTNFKVTRVEDLKGAKLAAGNRTLSKIYSALGITPVSMVTSEVYQNINRGLVKGTAVMWTAFQPYKYAEVTTHHLMVPLGGSPGMIIMNKDVYAKLPAKGKEAIDRNSGDVLMKNFSAFWDRINAAGEAMVRNKGGHTITVVSGAEREKLVHALEPIADEWAKSVPNGKAVLEAFRDEVKKVRMMKN